MKTIIKLHLSVLVGTLLAIPFGNIIIPYLYWKFHKENRVDISIQACNILNFQIIISLFFYGCMVFLWYLFLKDLANHLIPDYNNMVYPIIILLCTNIIYPIIVAFYIYIKRKNINYYPNIIRIFKY